MKFQDMSHEEFLFFLKCVVDNTHQPMKTTTNLTFQKVYEMMIGSREFMSIKYFSDTAIKEVLRNNCLAMCYIEARKRYQKFFNVKTLEYY